MAVLDPGFPGGSSQQRNPYLGGFSSQADNPYINNFSSADNFSSAVTGGPVDTTTPAGYAAATSGGGGGDNGGDVGAYLRSIGYNDPNVIQGMIDSGYQVPGDTGTGEPAVPSFDPSALQGEVGGAWDSYIAGLENQLGGLDPQAQAQRDIAQSQFGANLSGLDLSLGQGQADLASQTADVESNQVTNLRDLSSNIKNLFQSGSNYLGTRGAGDSSAANQYAYALTKLGSKQRTDLTNKTAEILDNIKGRATNLKNIYENEKNQIKATLDQNISAVTQWLQTQQQAIRTAQNEGRLQKGLDLSQISRELLNQAMQAAQRAKDTIQSRQDALDSWAISKSDNLQQLQANLQGVSKNPGYNLPQRSNISPNLGSSQQATAKPLFFGGGSDEDEGLFGAGSAVSQPLSRFR